MRDTILHKKPIRKERKARGSERGNGIVLYLDKNKLQEGGNKMDLKSVLGPKCPPIQKEEKKKTRRPKGKLQGLIVKEAEKNRIGGKRRKGEIPAVLPGGDCEEKMELFGRATARNRILSGERATEKCGKGKGRPRLAF